MRMSRRLANGAGSYQFYDYIGNTLHVCTQYSRPLGNQPYIPTGVTAKKIRLYGNVYIDRANMDYNSITGESDDGSVISAEMLYRGSSSYPFDSRYMSFDMAVKQFGEGFISQYGGISTIGMSYTQGGLSDAWHLVDVTGSIDIASAGTFTHKVVIDKKTSLSEPLGGAVYPAYLPNIQEIEGAQWSLFSFAEHVGASEEVVPSEDAFAGRMQTMRIYDADTGTQLARLHPCKRVVDGALGMYDEISGLFHEARNGPNAGTTFYVGNL